MKAYRNFVKIATAAGLVGAFSLIGASSVFAAPTPTSSTTTTSTTSPATSTSTAPAQNTSGSPGGTSCAAGGTGLAAASYTLAADAEPLLVSVNDSHAPLVSGGEDLVGFSPLSAQSELDNLQQSEGFAGSPDFGAFVDSLPGTLAGLLAGNGPPLPVIPGKVSSTANSPKSSETLGPYQISASTTATESQALALSGASASTGVSGIEASADTVVNPDCSVTSTAISHISLVNLGALANLGDVSTTTTVTEQPGGQPTMRTSISLGTFTLPVLGTIGVTDQGFTVAGLTVPSVAETVIKTLAAALGSSVNLQYLPATKVTQTLHNGNPSGLGVESAGLKLTYTANVATQGLVPVTLTLGRTFVSVSNTSPSTPADNGSGVAPSGTAPSLGSSDLGTGSSDLGTGSSDLGTGSSLGSIGSPATPGSSGIAGSPRTSPVERSVGVIGPSGESLYLILILAALAALGGSQLLRLLAVRLKLMRP
jgi:hypothetical protein